MAPRAVLRLPVDLVARLLGLPEDVHALHVTVDPLGLAINVIVTAPDMADTDTEHGAHPPMVFPTLARVDGLTRIQSLDYPRQQRAKEGV